MTDLQLFVLLHPIIATLCMGVLALIVGSFLNVVIHRLPVMLQTAWNMECHQGLNLAYTPPKSINLFLPRSFCPHCKKTVPIWHNIPLVSYCLLRGRCHQCKHPISLRYPLVEGLTLILSLLATYHLGFHTHLFFGLFFIWLVICLSFIDFEYQILPDVLTLGLLWLGLIANTQSLFISLPNAVFSAAGAYLCLWLLIKIFYLFTGKVGMGNGDFKLFAAMGAWFGWAGLPFILLVSSVLGTIVGLFYLARTGKNRDTQIPFGPFLCMSGVIYLLSGPY